jgi:hypothetical protein
MVKKKKIKKVEETKHKKVMPNHIQEYFAKIEGSKEAFHSRELFRASEEDVDIKTDLSIEEIILINKLLFNNELLKSKGIKPVYHNFLYKYMRLKISLDRKSRAEFVNINRGDKTEEAVNLLSGLSNITTPKK